MEDHSLDRQIDLGVTFENALKGFTLSLRVPTFGGH
jgi:hypothetical protein